MHICWENKEFCLLALRCRRYTNLLCCCFCSIACCMQFHFLFAVVWNKFIFIIFRHWLYWISNFLSIFIYVSNLYWISHFMPIESLSDWFKAHRRIWIGFQCPIISSFASIFHKFLDVDEQSTAGYPQVDLVLNAVLNHQYNGYGERHEKCNHCFIC